MDMGDIGLFNGRLLNAIQIVMIEESHWRGSHCSTIPKRPILKNNPRHLMPFHPSSECLNSFDRSDGITTCEITIETELLRNIFRVDLTALNDGFSQSKGHVCVIG